MKTMIPVSQIASIIYKTAKKAALNSSSDFDSKKEWKKAMKQAWATVHNTKEQRREATKEAWNEQEEKRKEFSKKQSAQLKNNVSALTERLRGNESPEQTLAECAYNEDQRFKKMGINCSAW